MRGGKIMGKDRSPWLRRILIFLGVALLAVIISSIFRSGASPDISIRPAMPMIGKRTPVTVEVSEPKLGLKHLKVELIQGDKVETMLDKNYVFRTALSFWGPKTDRDTVVVEVGRQTVPSLKAGSATIRVTADKIGNGLWNPGVVTQEISLPVRLTPPLLQVSSTQTYVAQGGCEVVVYRVGEASVRDGVSAGTLWFPGYELPGGGKEDRFALFAVPYDMSEADVRIVAEDAAGNQAERPFIDRFFPKQFKAETMNISDAFIEKVVPEILSRSPEISDRGNLLDNYLAINGELRQKNAETLKSMAQQSRQEFMWTKSFMFIPNAKVMAGFGDRRTYQYKGRVVDHQAHLGIDLAVVRQSPIPAANDGIVLCADFLGIYGNAVVIDHGFGLMTIYGHLSSVSVGQGQKVARGDIIGKTGETGLAGGDHLHFCTLLQGIPVNPVEWEDGHWIKDRIARKLGSALHFEE